MFEVKNLKARERMLGIPGLTGIIREERVKDGGRQVKEVYCQEPRLEQEQSPPSAYGYKISSTGTDGFAGTWRICLTLGLVPPLVSPKLTPSETAFLTKSRLCSTSVSR